MKKDMDHIIQCAKDAGCVVSKTKGGHWRIVTPDGVLIFLSSTPSDWRATKNAVALLGRYGIDVRGS